MQSSNRIALSLFLILSLNHAAQAAEPTPTQPKLRVGIVEAEDSWLTLGDGSRVVLGSNVSLILGHLLFQDGHFIPILLRNPSLSAQSKPDFANPSPAEWSDWLRTEQMSDLQSSSVRLDVTIKPIVETLLYTSGTRANRITYGFSPDFDNPYRHGTAENNSSHAQASGNEFVPAPGDALSCTKPDFFMGSFDSLFPGVDASNFGSDADEGTAIEIGGYGFGFKRKVYSVSTQVRFEVSALLNGQRKSLTYQAVANGADIWIAGSYQGFSLALEIHRRETLIEAMNRMLPVMIQALVAEQRQEPWSRVISDVDPSGLILLDGGRVDGITLGLKLASINGNRYQVTTVDEETSQLQKISGAANPTVNEVLTLESSGAAIASEMPNLGLFAFPDSGSGQVLQQNMIRRFDIQLADRPVGRADVQSQSLSNIGCIIQDIGTIRKLLTSILYPVGLWRFFNVFDQKLKLPTPSTASLQSNEKIYRVGFIGSGVDYNDSALKAVVTRSMAWLQNNGRNPQNLGFDFISLDSRASDDNGHETAAAKYLVSLVKNTKWALVPIKVIGPRSETHSGAVYDGFRYAVKEKLDALVVPWAPTIGASAYNDGIRLARDAGIEVFSPRGIWFPGNTGNYKTTGLGSKIGMNAAGTSAVEAAARWLNSQHN